MTLDLDPFLKEIIYLKYVPGVHRGKIFSIIPGDPGTHSYSQVWDTFPTFYKSPKTLQTHKKGYVPMESFTGIR